MEGYKGEHTDAELRDIYYLFRYDHEDYEDMIKQRFPMLLKYKNILYRVLNDVYLFKGSAPYFHSSRYQAIGFGYNSDIVERSFEDGIKFMYYLLDTLYRVPNKDLDLITNELLDTINHDFTGNILCKLRTLLLPKYMLETDRDLYFDNIVGFIKGESEINRYRDRSEALKYHHLYEYTKRLFSFEKLSKYAYDPNSTNFFYMMVAYFYANISDYNNDYSLLDNMLLNFYDCEEIYLEEYSKSYKYEREHDYRYDDLDSIYSFIERKIPQLMRTNNNPMKIITESKKMVIERIGNLVATGQMSIPAGCDYLKKAFGFSKCIFSRDGIELLEYPNGTRFDLSYSKDDICCNEKQIKL